MTVVEWWYGLDKGFVATGDFLNETIAARIAERDVIVHPPSITLDDGVGASWLAPPRVLGRPALRSEEYWGMVHHGTKSDPVGVVVKQLAFTTEIDDGADVEATAELIAGAMDVWWDHVRGWLEVMAGQHLTMVGHHKMEYIGSKTPMWALCKDGTRRTPISIAGSSSIRLGREKVVGVDRDIFRDCVSLADEGPSLAWILLRDARSLAAAGQFRRAIIDAATAGELAVTAMLDASLNTETQNEATRLRIGANNLGRKLGLLASRGHSLPQSFRRDLVYKRNDAVHEGIPISPGDCRAAIVEAAGVVETAFPLPTPPGASRALRRLW